jgi:hypothetical protein
MPRLNWYITRPFLSILQEHETQTSAVCSL